MTRRGPRPARGGSLAVLVVVVAATATATAAAAPPALSARTAILVSPQTGDVVYARRPDARRQVASTTKLMTALLTLEKVKLSDVLTAVRYSGASAESLLGLRAGERLTVADLLRALLLPSANDAAETIAVGVGGSPSRFVARMNRRARALGLRNTHYANPVGLDDPDNYSTARDLVKLAQVLLRNRFFAATVDRPNAILRSGARPRVIVNRNVLVRQVPFVDGVKTGHTSTAGYVLVGAATRGGVTMLSAVLGDPSESARDADSLALLRYGLGRYHRVTAVSAHRRLATASVEDQGSAQVTLVASRTVRRVARRGERVTVRLVDAPDQISGPMHAGTRVGSVEVRQRGRTVATVALVTASDVPSPTLGERMRSWLGSTLTILLLGGLAICTVQLVALRRRALRRRRRPRDSRPSHPSETT